MATAIIPALDWGSITSNNQATWAGAQGASTGTIQSPNVIEDVEIYAIAGSRSNTYRVSRFFMWFDTSPYAGNITALDYYFPSGGQQGNAEYIIDESTAFGGAGAGSPLVGNDFNNAAFQTALTGPFYWSLGGIVTVPGNTNSVLLANTGVLNNAILDFNYDDSNTSPPLPTTTSVDIVQGEPIDIYIEITYSTGWAGGNSINGVALADLGSMNGIPFTDIASINGI